MFSHLKKLEVADKAAWIDLPELGRGARVECRFAGDSNPAYLNARLTIARGRPSVTDVLESLRLDREDDREVFPRTVMVRWENVCDDKGQPVEFNRANAAELLRQLPNYIFDRVRREAARPSKFLEQAQEADSPALAGN